MGTENREKEMSFVDHLDELRKRLIICVLAMAVGAGGSWRFTLDALRFLAGPKGHLQYLGPADAFMVRIKIALLLGMVVVAPVILVQIWLFVAPGLKSLERRYAMPVVIISCLLFYGGLVFGVFAVPISIEALKGFGGDVLTANYTVDRFVSFATTIVLAFGVVFEMPVVFAFLAKIGIVSYSGIAQKRKYYYFCILIAAAGIMPGDVSSMVILLVPLFILFEISVFLTRFIRPAMM